MRNKEKLYRKWSIMAIGIVTILSVIIFIFLRRHEVRLEKYEFDSSLVTTESYQYNIDSIAEINDVVSITGWLIKEGTDIGVIERYLVIKDKYSDKSYKLPTEIIQRPDLNDYIGDNINYSDSGFLGIVSVKELGFTKELELYIVDSSDGQVKIIKLSDNFREAVSNGY